MLKDDILALQTQHEAILRKMLANLDQGAKKHGLTHVAQVVGKMREVQDLLADINVLLHNKQ